MRMQRNADVTLRYGLADIGTPNYEAWHLEYRIEMAWIYAIYGREHWPSGIVWADWGFE
jgi:hypothetical protein